MDQISLVIQLQSKLNLPRIVGSIASGSNLSEVATGEVGGAADGDNAVAAESRRVEVRVVKDVEELRPELQTETFVELEVLKG